MTKRKTEYDSETVTESITCPNCGFNLDLHTSLVAAAQGDDTSEHTRLVQEASLAKELADPVVDASNSSE